MWKEKHSKFIFKFFFPKIAKKYGMYQFVTLIEYLNVSTLDVVQKANCMLVAYIPLYKLYRIHWNFPDFLNTCTQFINFTMWKTVKSSELKRLTFTKHIGEEISHLIQTEKDKTHGQKQSLKLWKIVFTCIDYYCTCEEESELWEKSHAFGM